MRKYFLTLCVALISVCAFAQKNQIAVGAGAAYATDDSNIGIYVKGQYNLTDNIRFEASYDKYFKKDYLSFTDVNLNAHYLLHLSESFKIYPIAGVSYTTVSGGYHYYSVSYATTSGHDLSLNVGIGIQVDVNDHWGVSVEGKYQIDGLDQCVVRAGAIYKF